jgi:uncharacterized small protein (DUF1192 family)
MDFEELDPKTKKPQPRNLQPMSIAELGAYIETLKAEIARVEAEIAAKKAQQTGAASLFKF